MNAPEERVLRKKTKDGGLKKRKRESADQKNE